MAPTHFLLHLRGAAFVHGRFKKFGDLQDAVKLAIAFVFVDTRQVRCFYLRLSKAPNTFFFFGAIFARYCCDIFAAVLNLFGLCHLGRVYEGKGG